MFRFDAIARYLGKLPAAGFITGYGLAAGAAMGCMMFGANAHKDLLERVCAVAVTILSAVLVTVTTWYRRENVVNAAILLALAWTLARVLAVCTATILLWGSLGGVGFAMLGVVFGVPIGILVAMIVGGALVAVLRWIRPPFTPPSVSGSSAD